VAEQVIRPAHPPADLFQQVHHAEIGHRVDPKHLGRIGRQYADAGLHAATDLLQQLGQHAQGLIMVRAEMDRKRLGDQHLERRQGARTGGEGKLAERGQNGADLVRPRDPGRKPVVGQPLSGIRL